MSDQTNTSSQNPASTGNATVQSPQSIEQELTNAANITKNEIQHDPAAAQELGATTELQNEVVDIEKELLGEIMKRLDQESMSEEDAGNLAAEFLELLPVKDQTDLLKKLQILSENNPAAKGIYIEYNKPYEADETQKKLALMSQHIHQGKIEEALAVAKGGKNA